MKKARDFVELPANSVIPETDMMKSKLAGLLFILIPAALPGLAQDIFYDRLADSALSLTRQRVRYEPAYVVLAYPNGDVPADQGVCSDVVIRAYRKTGTDLQREVHEDMRSHFGKYPKNWGLSGPDKNIDHRRVPNLMTFFERHGTSLPLSQKAADYRPGDIVCWRLSGGQTHIGIVSREKNPTRTRHMIIHNIGAGQVLEDCLFSYTVIGHYRYRKITGQI